MFANYFYYGNELLSVFQSQHVPRIGEHVKMHNAFYEITGVAYDLNKNMQGIISVVIDLRLK